MRRAVVVAVVALAVVVSGCGKDEPSEYNDEVEATFLQTCTDQGGDDLQDVCQCAYDSFVREIPFDRFQRVDQRLEDDPEAQLPDEFLDLYTDCVIQSGGGSAGTTPEFPTTTTTSTTLAPGASTTVPGVTDTTVAP